MTIVVHDNAVFIYTEQVTLPDMDLIINKEHDINTKIYIEGFEICKNSPTSRKTITLCKKS